MKKMKKIFLAVLLAGLSSAPGYAATSPYVSGSLGVGFPGKSDISSGGTTYKDAISYKSGIPFGGAVGIKNDAYRAEVFLGYQTNDLDKFTISGTETSGAGYSASVFLYMVNGYYDFMDKNSNVSPYLTVGLGGASIHAKGPDTDETKNVFTWQAGLGVGVKAGDNLMVDLGYRYIKPGSFSAYNVGDVTASTHNIMAGIRYEFN